ncbi:hypothetical protein EX895_003747 [Sporisorium graminicola]|uniref:Uncharacterized protein n=1 Tax=Sporisorium graminicola TaxID=280036 RepID=A0A4U7KRK8_9BASI|nr:hypothetical protein EX895_003747 [Sporisorium graminicola]TKY87070.1 hypothetical protein EX895_003747 [Sporisorium graminicola]
MSYWDNKSKIVVQNDEGRNTAVKNRFPHSSSGASQTLPAILARLSTGEIEYDSLVITVRGVQREDVPLLMFGTRQGSISERDTDNRGADVASADTAMRSP